MASVHLARMDGPGGFQKWVAIKRIHPHLVEDDQFVDMFLDEARIAAGINHANVAQVFDLGKDDNTYWIAMEYLHGEPLREIMRRAEERNMLISPDLAARICADAAEGLHAAHELRGKNGQLLGLVHRDVTPHNLFITYEGYTKVVDFGIAKVADRLSQTRAGTLKGKLAYMSPEQVRGAEVDRTTDVFALGVVLWELTTNQRLFRMDTDLDTLEKVQACIVPPPSTIIRDYPVELESVVMKALAKRKQDRYATAREFSKALQNYLLRRGAFVGPEEVAQFIRHVFSDRIEKREAHLAWAAEVTGTLNVEQIRAGGGKPGAEEEISLVDEVEERPRQGGPPPQQQQPPPQQQQQHKATPMPMPMPAPQPPPPQQQQMAATSLLDDDEDVPTTVASRDHIEAMSAAAAQQAQGPQRGMPQPEQSRPRPAAGMPSGNANPGFGPRPGQFPMNDERTAALPGGMYPGGNGGGDDLGATVALPSSLKQQEYGRPPPQQQQQQQQPQNPGFGMGGGFAPMQQQHEPPRFQSQQPFTPTYGVQPGAYPNMPMPGPGGMPRQSQIETAVSLPRPDPAAVWLAQQEVNRGTRKNTGVLIAVVALTALCVIGISALIYYKLKMAAPTPTPVGAEMTSPSGAASAAPAAMAAPSATAAAAAAAPTSQPSAVSASSAPSAAPAPSAATAAAAPAAAGASPAAASPGAGAPAAAASAAPGAAKEEPGFLTVVCNPYCDDVIDQGRSLGPSPVVHVSVKPGQHRITLKRGSETKVISVIVVSGQVTAQRVSMK
jgi:serine/threonine protein kinase